MMCRAVGPTTVKKREYEKLHVRSFRFMAWGNEFPWVRHTVMIDTNGADKN